MIENVGLKFTSNLTPLKKVEKIVLHHPDHATWGIKDIHDFHIRVRKWIGIGYNYFITFDGRIQEGRGRNQGAHCLDGWNSKSLGICFQGAFDTNNNMTDAQVKAGAKLIASLLKTEGLQLTDVVGHKELWATSCPGRFFRMTDLKQAILEELNPSVKKEVVNVNEPSSWAKASMEKAMKFEYSPGKFLTDGTKPKEPLTLERFIVILDRLGLIKEGK